MALARHVKTGIVVRVAAVLAVPGESAPSERLLDAQPSASIVIEVVNGYDNEQTAKKQLDRVLATYDIDRWMYTKRIAINDDEWIPYSHPVLTVNSRYLDDDAAQLATLLHEQFHWYAETVQAELSAAIAEFREIYPEVLAGPAGPRSEYSTYLHLVICDLEYQVLEVLLGDTEARRVIGNWKHYPWVYEQVLHNSGIRRVNAAHGLTVSTAPADH